MTALVSANNSANSIHQPERLARSEGMAQLRKLSAFS